MAERDTSAPEASANLTLADALVRELDAAGITHVFGIGGTHTVPLFSALERAPRLSYVAARTELGAAYMAIGFARASRLPSVVLTSTGPGALNVLSALQDAAWSSTPVLHLTTRIGGKAFAGAIHETPGQSALLRLVGKSVVDVDARNLGPQMRRAMQMAMSDPRGPVTIQIEAGTWADEVTSGTCTAFLKNSARATPAPDAAGVDEVANAIERCSRPVIFTGGGSLVHDGGAAVLRLARTLQAPVLTSYQGKNIADWTEELYLGPWGWEQPVHDLFAEADLALVFGTKLTASGTGHWRLPMPPCAYRIGLPPSAHPRYPQVRPIAGDAADIAGQLTDQLAARKPWATQLTQLREQVLSSAGQRGPKEIASIAALATAKGTPSWLTLDMTTAGFWVLKYLPAKAPAAHLISGYLAMGTALSMAIGTSIATGDAALAVVGDGGLQMGLAELATLAEHRLPITVLVIVNDAYELLRDGRTAIRGDSPLGVSLWNPNFSRLASAFDIPNQSITSPRQLRDALAEPCGGPRLLLAALPFSRNW